MAYIDENSTVEDVVKFWIWDGSSIEEAITMTKMLRTNVDPFSERQMKLFEEYENSLNLQ